MKLSIGWERAIVKVFENNHGIVTLKKLYEEVPLLIHKSGSEDLNHTIRAYLRRLKQQKKVIKQIGLSTYSLAGLSYPKPFYEEIIEHSIETKDLKSIPKKEMHGFIEGMLIELGNFYNFDTYTPDTNVIFNGKPLMELIVHQVIPKFTFVSIMNKVRQIDVIWFKDEFPIKTFDVENSTDFTKALFRAYQLKYFKTEFFVVANDDKKTIYNDRINMKPFDSIKSDVKFIPYTKIFDIYKEAVVANRKLKESKII